MTKSAIERKGRKYFVVPAEAWNTFKASIEAPESASLQGAHQTADALATAAEEAAPKSQHSFAIIEEAGFLETEVQTKVKRSFTTSRQIIRRDKPEGMEKTANESQETDNSVESTTSGKRNKKGRNRE